MGRSYVNYTPLEEHDQASLASVLDQADVVWCHVPNEGKRSVVMAARMKRQGLKKGCPDNFIFTPPPNYPSKKGTVIELKRRVGGRVSPEQEEWIAKLCNLGWNAVVCKGIDEALEVLRNSGYIK
jgi:hypothetical protein